MKTYKAQERHVVELDSTEWKILKNNIGAIKSGSTLYDGHDYFDTLYMFIESQLPGVKNFYVTTGLCSLSTEDFTFSEGKIYIDVETDDQYQIPAGAVEKIIDTIKMLL